MDDIAEELGGSGGPIGVPVSRVVDLRHQLTALIKSELYGGGSKTEGRAALMARQRLDEFFFRTEQSQFAQGRVTDLAPLKRGIILETLAELVDLLDQARNAGGGSIRGLRAQMQKLVNDPDRFARFNDEDKAALRKMADGSALFVKSRFNRLHVAIRRRGIPFMGGSQT